MPEVKAGDELAILEKCAKHLDTLDAEAQRRVLWYLTAKFVGATVADPILRAAAQEGT